MSYIGEAILSASVSLIIDKLASQDLLRLARRELVHKDLKKWEKILRKICAVLEDAEEKQISNDRVIKIWLEDLQLLAYDIDDILDEFYTECLRQKLKEKQGSSSGKVCSVIPRCFAPFNPDNLMFNFNVGSKIKSITGRLEVIVKQKDDLELREYSSCSEGKSCNTSSRSFKRLPSTSLIDGHQVLGREEEKERILEFLLSSEQNCDDDDDVGICVIPIVGMGGLGKTTLAQIVYNDESVMRFFDLRAWVYVSEDFDVVRVTKTILEAVTLESCNAKDFNFLQVKLREGLVGKKFLIVLDDVWNESYEAWALFRRSFEVRCPSGKIIVTTRNQGVADIMRTIPSQHLKELSFDDCLCLFAKHALGRKDFDSHQHLKEIGGRIVQRCRGLPLAVKTLGGLLRTKPNLDEWENILNSKMWDLPEDKSGILPALRLSYHHLPSHLKQLFVFCSIFPKGYGFYQDELVLLWMAEGFLKNPEEKKHIESLYSHFNELLSRSFFQRSNSTEPQFVMHDLISDLAQSAAGEIYIGLNDKFEGNKHYLNAERTRHMSFSRHTYDVWNRFKDLGKLQHLRTFIALPILPSSWAACCYVSNNVLRELLPRLRCLRVLSLSGYCISQLPNSISDLKLLRYLNLSCTRIKQLPESVTTLLNLQALILSGCRKLIVLPQSIGNLINLCSLDLTDTINLCQMPPGIGNLKCLRKLPKFIVGKDNGCGIRELKGLTNIRGQLSILGLHNVVDDCHAVDANLGDMHNLVELELEWSSNIDDHGNQEYERQVLNSLQPHTSLKKLKVSFYGGPKFPAWIGDPSFAKMTQLKLYSCRNCTSLPSLGRLPSLRILCIEHMDSVKTVDGEFYGNGSCSAIPFASLETLKFEDMLQWEQWLPSTGCGKEAQDKFPHLRELTLLHCPKLIGKLPSHLASLSKLTVCKCPMLEDSLISLPSLQELNLEACNQDAFRHMVCSTALSTLRIRSMPDLTCVQNLFMQSPGAVKVLMISNCKKLMTLWQKGTGLENCLGLEQILIEDCPQFVSLAENDGSISSSPENLDMLDCNSQEQLPYKLNDKIPFKDLCNESCSKFVSIPSTLRQLVLRNCWALESLPHDIMMLGHRYNQCILEDLEIEDCPFLQCFPRGRLPTTLKMLKIRYCKNLQSLPEGITHNDNSTNDLSHLEQLEIIGCPSLTLFPEGKLPFWLKQLKVWDCKQLETLSESMLHENTSLEYVSIWNCTTLASLPECRHSLTHLIELNINNCSSLRSFPEVGLFLPNLRTLSIQECENLKFLPTSIEDLASLQELTICSCPSLLSFPKGGLPPNLISLEIWDCENLDWLTSGWKLRSLSCLRDFSIAGGCFSNAVCFPDNKFPLPPNLISIWIGKLPNLESLSIRLQSLTSLEELEIVKCPKLQFLPKGSLPYTLGRISIRDCPLLKQRCFKEKGVFWPMISHIPCVEMDCEDM